MIKQLRKRFILIAMSSFFIVVFLIVGLTSLSYYLRVQNEIEENLSVIIENLDDIEKQEVYSIQMDIEEYAEKSRYQDKDNEGKDVIDEILNGVRFFTVTIDGNGKVIAANTHNTRTVNERKAGKIATSLYKEHKTEGYYRYRKYRAVKKGETTVYVFVNTKGKITACQTFIKNSIYSACVELLILIFPVWFFSGYVVKPVRESSEKQKTFITNAGHEIKTSLTIIDANTDVIELTAGETEWTRSIRNQIKRLSKLTEQLVILAKLEEFEKLSEDRKVELSDMVTEISEQFETVADMHGKCLKTEIAPALQFHGDTEMLEWLFSILFDNAVKYADAKTAIYANLSKRGKQIIFEIENQAADIRQGKHDELFDRFYRADLSRNSATGGYGIGLSAAKTIVELHKGRITADSEHDGIIKFQIFLKI